MEILGIDIGGTGMKGAVVNTKTGELVSEKYRIPTPEGARPEDMTKIIGKLVNHFEWTGKIGCGFPATVFDGKVGTFGNLHESWKGRQADKLFEAETGRKINIINDADAAGLAEIKFGTGKGQKGTVIMITLGTGIGSGMFYNGKLIPNIELGLLPYKKDFHFELFAANAVRKKEDLSFKKWGKRLDKFLILVDKIFSPELLIIGGGISKKLHKYKPYFSIETPVVQAEFKNEAGIVGAALAANE
ncbi:MAG: polyphosphate glucokinase [Flavobacteriales bacterium]|nr:MAG: polyphosphate glucokinase [Flavobacteriales bacterium]